MVNDELSELKASFDRAKAFLNAGDAKMAEDLCRKALSQVSNGDPNTQVLLCVALIRQGKSGSAVKRLKHTLRMFPDFAPAHEELGNALLAQNKPEKALPCFEKAVDLNPKNASALITLGKIYKALGRKEEAQEIYQTVLELDPIQEKLASATQLFYRGEIEEAEKICREALQEKPDDVNGLKLLASIASKMEQREDAIILLQRAVELKPKFSGAWADLAETLSDSDEFGKALDAAQRVIKLQPNLPFGFMLRGTILGQSGNHEGAINAYREALKIEPNHIGSNMGLGNTLKTIGDYEESVSAYKKVIEFQPFFAEAYWSLANLKTYQFDQKEIAQMEDHIENPDIPDSNKAFFHIALANAKEKEKLFDKAWHHFDAGAFMRRKDEVYDSVQTQTTHDSLIEVFNKEFINEKRNLGHQSQAPIFIVGLPRSGSTLIEQILASHSQIEGTKELPDLSLLTRKLTKSKPRGIKFPNAALEMTDDEFIEYGESYLTTTKRHRSGSPYFIDKMPNNFANIGFLKLILPNAKIINACRHPLDSCISSYKQLFYKGQSWSYDLFEVAEYYLEYDRMMRHWHDAFPGEIMDFHYESVLDNQESETKKLLEYCGLEWEEQCLKFYETKRSINTASSEQVRQPLYKGAMYAWKNYESHIGPLIETLEPLLKNLTDDAKPQSLKEL